MAQENVELVRSILAAWERGDYSSADWADTEIEFKLADGPAPGSWQGLTGMAAGWRSVLTAWEQMRQIPDEVRDVDAERVLSLHHYRARGKRSGLDLGDMRGEAAAIFHISNAKVTRIVHYFDRSAALQAAGLPGE
jgi:ketosteroid isomerase-like protein